MKQSSELRLAARNTLRGNWPGAVVCTIVYIAVALVVSCLPTVLANPDNPSSSGAYGLLSLLLTILALNPLELGFYNAYRMLYQDGDQNLISNTFSLPFKNYSHYVWGMLLMGIKIFLWSLLFIIPGIIKYFSYSMTPYILMEHPELSASEAIRTSKLMMKGHKFDLFYLYLTFIGWFLLSMLTAGIGLLWLTPYVRTAVAAFYADLKTSEGVIEATVVG